MSQMINFRVGNNNYMKTKNKKAKELINKLFEKLLELTHMIETLEFE